MTTFRYFATCAKGLEPVLHKELAALGAAQVEPSRGGVAFAGDQLLLYQANLELRTAIRVLKPILNAHVESPEELYDAVRSVDWTQWLTPDHTLAVDANVRDSRITHSHYAALKTKDAICDWFVDRVGRRPSVDVECPMVGFNLHLYRNEMVLSLDSSGESLHKRGYRPIQTKAPLNEALAAGLVLLSEWQPLCPLVDPMCGSGTILIEAAMIALRHPPRLTRKRFGFQGWLDFDIQSWTALRDEARSKIGHQLPAPILGSDIRSDAIAFANKNAKAAGFGHLLHFERKALQEWHPPVRDPGFILVNPPYGERLGEPQAVEPIYQTMAKVFTARAKGWTVFIFSGNERFEQIFPIAPFTRIPLFNGRIPCQLLGYKM